MKKDSKYYWLIPFVFIGIFSDSEVGITSSIYLTFTAISINGGPVRYLFPANYLLWYNSSTGPLSSIFLSNFLWDGWTNFIALLVYFMAFMIVVAKSPYRMQKAWFLVIGSILSGVLDAAIIRLILPPRVVLYGQSAVVAGFAGIMSFYIVWETIREMTNFRKNNLAKINKFNIKHGYDTGTSTIHLVSYLFVSILVVVTLWVFLTPAVPEMIRQVHALALSIGIILAGIFTLLTEARPEEKMEKNVANNISNIEGAQE